MCFLKFFYPYQGSPLLQYHKDISKRNFFKHVGAFNELEFKYLRGTRETTGMQCGRK